MVITTFLTGNPFRRCVVFCSWQARILRPSAITGYMPIIPFRRTCLRLLPQNSNSNMDGHSVFFSSWNVSRYWPVFRISVNQEKLQKKKKFCDYGNLMVYWIQKSTICSIHLFKGRTYESEINNTGKTKRFKGRPQPYPWITCSGNKNFQNCPLFLWNRWTERHSPYRHCKTGWIL